MPYRSYPSAPSASELRQLVPELPADHLARLVEQVVEEAVIPPPRPPGKGNPPYDPRLCTKVLLYGYATGTRSSRQLERLCEENIAYLFLTRGDTPSYHTLTTFRKEEAAVIDQVWVSLFAVAERAGLQRVGRIVVDSTKMRANASPEAVLTRDEFGPIRAVLQQILEEAQEVDTREDQEGYPGQTHLGEAVPPTQMREIVRRVRRRLARQQRATTTAAEPGETADEPAQDEEAPAPAPEAEGAQSGAAGGGCAPEGSAAAAAAVVVAPPAGGWGRFTKRMLDRLKAALAALVAAETAGLKHLCLTDPDARMMGEGREKKIRECHSFEIAVDQGVLVVAQTSQETADNGRLGIVVAAAQEHEPEGVVAATADCGYYAGDDVGRLIEAGIDTCVPDTNTACDLHRGQPIGTQQSKTRGSVPLVFVEEADHLLCPKGNVLVFEQTRQHYGQRVREYRAQNSCVGCPLAGECLTQANAKYRTASIGQYHQELAAARERFAQPEHQERYRHRGEAVETVFGFVRGTLEYRRWLLRGREGVAREGRLFGMGYQLRKIHAAMLAS